jgi:hypothetical protein
VDALHADKPADDAGLARNMALLYLVFEGAWGEIRVESRAIHLRGAPDRGIHG